jgi:hypothetical protein
MIAKRLVVIIFRLSHARRRRSKDLEIHKDAPLAHVAAMAAGDLPAKPFDEFAKVIDAELTKLKLPVPPPPAKAAEKPDG